MKKVAVLMAGVLFTSFTACSQNKQITASENYISKKIDVEQFNGVKISGSANIVYTPASKQSLEIYGSDNIIDLLDTYVENQTLIVKFKKNTNIRKRGKLEIKVSTPELAYLNINGSGGVILNKGTKSSKDFHIDINGSGDVKGESICCQQMFVSINGSGDVILKDIDSKTCSVGISGSGDISLSGNTQTAKYSIAGSGEIEAVNLKAEYVSSSISGSGDISCYATKSLKGRVNGSGNLSYKGDPQEIDFPRKGLRKID